MIKLCCYVKSPYRSSEAGNNQETELTTTMTTKKVVEDDNWEFPREKLKLLQKLGKVAI